MTDDAKDIGGLSKAAVKLLGFEQPCRCGHPFGLHEPKIWNELNGPHRCVEVNCKCEEFKP